MSHNKLEYNGIRYDKLSAEDLIGMEFTIVEEAENRWPGSNTKISQMHRLDNDVESCHSPSSGWGFHPPQTRWQI